MNTNNISPELDIVSLIKLLFSKKGVIAVYTVFFFICSIIYLLLATPVYTASTSILPTNESDGGAGLGGFQNIASQFGLFTGSSGNLSDIFPSILKSEALLYPILDSTFIDPESNSSKTLLEYINIDETEPERAKRLAYEKLIENITVDVNDRSKLITISVNSKHPWLAAEIANIMAKELNNYTVEYKTADARDLRQFLQEQDNQYDRDLNEIDDTIALFRKENLNYIDSEELMKEYQKLAREQEARKTIWIQGRQQLELAKLQEVKDTPNIRVLDIAKTPFEPSHPKKLIILIVSVFIGFVFGCFSVIILDKFYSKP